MKNCCYNLIILSLLMISSLISCEKPDVIKDSNLLNSLYANSFDTLKIEASEFVLETDLSRNLMPGGPIPKKHPLVALVFLVNIDSLPVSTNINITKLYVVKAQLIWISNPVDFNQPQVPDFKLDKVSRDGPEWETDIYVDVIAEVVNNSIRDKYLLIVRHQYIMKLE